MKNGGEKGDNEGEPIATARVKQPADNEARQRVGVNVKEKPETAAIATADQRSDRDGQR